jgi:hypothetical protein
MDISENKSLLWGIGMLAVGGLITLSTHTSAGPGGNYIVTTGLFAVGGFSLLRGIYYQIRYGSKA